jgi:hypothetical protein
VVVDRGIANDKNIAEIKVRKLHYLLASRQPERRRWLAEFADPEGFAEVRPYRCRSAGRCGRLSGRTASNRQTALASSNISRCSAKS